MRSEKYIVATAILMGEVPTVARVEKVSDWWSSSYANCRAESNYLHAPGQAYTVVVRVTADRASVIGKHSRAMMPDVSDGIERVILSAIESAIESAKDACRLSDEKYAPFAAEPIQSGETTGGADGWDAPSPPAVPTSGTSSYTHFRERAESMAEIYTTTETREDGSVTVEWWGGRKGWEQAMSIIAMLMAGRDAIAVTLRRLG